MSDERFAGRVAIVTGGANGIGAATVRRLAEEGAAVVVADLDAAAGEALVAEVGDRSRFVAADVARPGAWRELVEAAHGFGGLDAVVTNAFAVQVAAADRLDPEGWDRQIDVCLTQVYLAARACLPELARSTADGGGALVAVSSVHAHAGFPGHPAYAAAKGGICALVRQLAVEYGPAVRINAVLPGSIETRVWDGATAAQRREVAERSALRRMGRPEEIAAAIAFLASADASFVTGTELLVDGGWLVSSLSPTARSGTG